ncbi:MAG: hypothetical protein AAF485_27825 [Chloroflexota bacterium]
MSESYPDLSGLTVRQLRDFCKERKITGYSKCPRKADLLAFIRERIADCVGDRNCEAGDDAPQTTDVESLDVAEPARATAETETPDVAIDELVASTTSGVSELLLTAYPGEIGVRGRERLSHFSLYSTETLGELFGCSSSLDRPALDQQKSPQADGAIANFGQSAIPWGDFTYQGANIIPIPSRIGADITRIAGRATVTAATQLTAMGGWYFHRADLAPTNTDLRGITLARQSITITASHFQASMCYGPHSLEAAANPTPHLLLTQPSYMDRARPTGSLHPGTNPARAP